MKEFFNVFLCAIFLQAFFSCNKGDNPAGCIAETGDATAVTAFTAKISGYCSQKNLEGLSVTYGIEYTDSDLTRNAIVLNASEIDENGLFSVDVENLNPGTEYFYRTFVLYNRAYSFGKVERFTTLAHPEPEKIFPIQKMFPFMQMVLQIMRLICVSVYSIQTPSIITSVVSQCRSELWLVIDMPLKQSTKQTFVGTLLSFVHTYELVHTRIIRVCTNQKI